LQKNVKEIENQSFKDYQENFNNREISLTPQRKSLDKKILKSFNKVKVLRNSMNQENVNLCSKASSIALKFKFKNQDDTPKYIVEKEINQKQLVDINN